MTYTKQSWVKGDVITADRLNHMEEGIGLLSEQNYNAMEYGAKGDGAANDAPALNALVKQVAAAGGGTIYLPQGVYMVDARVNWRSNVSLIGDGIGRTVIKPRKTDGASQGFAAISWRDDSDTGGNYTADDPMTNCMFRDFTIDGSEMNVDAAYFDSYPKGINIHFLKDCVFENLSFQNTVATGLGVDFLRNVVIRNIYCYNCGRGYVVSPTESVIGSAGIGIGTMGMPVESCVISDCIADSCGNYGIFVEGGGTFVTDADGNEASDSHYTIANCQCINGRNYGIVAKGTHNVAISGNICKGNARDGIATVQRESRYCDGVTITGNQCVGNGGNGIRLADSTGNSKNVFVQGNDCRGNTGAGLLLETSISGVTVTGNAFTANARGAATENVNFYDVNFHGNIVRDNTTQNWDIHGTFDNSSPMNQSVTTLFPLEYEWVNGYHDNTGALIESTRNFTTDRFFYCGGASNVGFETDAYTQAGSENRVLYCSFYDNTLTFLSRTGVTENTKTVRKIAVPEGACYIKFRVGLNSIDAAQELLNTVRLLIYATDRD